MGKLLLRLLIPHFPPSHGAFGEIGTSGGGWVQIETVLVRLNTTYVPRGSFPAYSNQSIPDVNGKETRLGYDAAVCIELYEPWIVETYNGTTGLPNTLRIAGPGSTMQDTPAVGEKRKGPMLSDVQRVLNSTGKSPPFAVAHDNSVNQIVKVSRPLLACDLCDR
jgi:hypothetical protein